MLRLRLDSINARDFAQYIAEVIEVPALDADYDVDLLLHDPAHVRVAYADRRGGLRYVDPLTLGEPTFLYDWAFEQDGRVQWIAQLRSWNPVRELDSRKVFLMVDCARMTAEDRCPAAFARAYGEPAARIYRDAVAGIDERPIDFHVFDSGRHTEAYIRRRMAAHGFRREAFRV